MKQTGTEASREGLTKKARSRRFSQGLFRPEEAEVDGERVGLERAGDGFEEEVGGADETVVLGGLAKHALKNDVALISARRGRRDIGEREGAGEAAGGEIEGGDSPRARIGGPGERQQVDAAAGCFY